MNIDWVFKNFFARRCQDKVTNFSGVVCSVAFDISGCIQLYLRPNVNKDNALADGYWFDWDRLTILSEPVMNVPPFDQVPVNMRGANTGAEHKPAPR